MNQKEIDFYKRLKEELDTTTQFPTVYLFKFIVPVSEEKVLQIKTSFAGTNAQIVTKASSTGKFNSVSVKVMMPSSQSVIDKYVELSSIDGIISL